MFHRIRQCYDDKQIQRTVVLIDKFENYFSSLKNDSQQELLSVLVDILSLKILCMGHMSEKQQHTLPSIKQTQAEIQSLLQKISNNERYVTEANVCNNSTKFYFYYFGIVCLSFFFL